MLGRIVKLGFVPSSVDAGLLAVRVIAFASLFLKHGYEKIFSFSRMAPTFSDPVHLGPTTSLVFAMLSDGICSLLIVFGLATRWACAYSFIIIFVAWAFRYHFLFFGARETGDHGELIVLYLACLIGIFIAGPGRYSIDATAFVEERE